MSNNGWCPFADHQPSPYFWESHRARRAVVLHIAEGGFQSSVDYLLTVKLSAHFIISKAGNIIQMVSINDSALANGASYSNGQWYNPAGKPVKPDWPDLIIGSNPNLYTISIEHEGYFGEKWTDPMLQANNKVLKWIATQYPMMYTPQRTLIGHCNIDPIDRANCPGPNVNFARIATLANKKPQPNPYTIDSPMLGTPLADKSLVISYIQNRLPATSGYTYSDVEDIIGFYWQHALPCGVDPFVAATQCVFETDALRSYWSQRPRRNPAGLGVRQEGGWSFPSWYDAVQAHVGQLLAFALTDDEANATQKAMIERNPRHAYITAEQRGSAKTVAGLNQWTDDPAYAGNLLARMNAVMNS